MIHRCFTKSYVSIISIISIISIEWRDTIVSLQKRMSYVVLVNLQTYVHVMRSIIKGVHLNLIYALYALLIPAY